MLKRLKNIIIRIQTHQIYFFNIGFFEMHTFSF